MSKNDEDYVTLANGWLFGKSDAHITHRRADAFFDDVIAHASDWDLYVGKVISIYGVGGEGKSVFVNSLRDNCQKRLPSKHWRTVYLDFYSEESSNLIMLREIFEAFAAAGIFCPRFAVAYQSFQNPGNQELAAQRYLLEYDKWLTESCSLMSSASGPIDTFLGITSIATDLAGTVLQVSPLRDTLELVRNSKEAHRQRQILDSAKEIWQNLANHGKTALIDRMPKLLLQDLTEQVEHMAQNTPPCKPIVIVDSFEHLYEDGAIGDLSAIGELVQTLTRIPNTLWVVAGRNGLSGSGWDNVVQYPIELVDLDEAGVEAMLAAQGISDSELAKEIYRFSGGLPLFVSLCLDALERSPDEELRLSFAQLVRTHETRERLLRHFVSDLDDDMEIAVYAMSYLHEWDEDLLSRLLSLDVMDADMAELVAEDAPRLSFVLPRANRYQMHERIAAMLRSLKPNKRKMKRSFRKLFRSMCRMLTEVKHDDTLRTEDARYLRLILSRGIWEMSKHGREAYGRMSADELFEIRRDYIEELKWAHRFREAISVTDEMLPLYAGCIEQELTLLLTKAANLTQMWLRTDDISYHMDAIGIERGVLARIEEEGTDGHRALYRRTRNSLGLSTMRIAEAFPNIEESLTYLGPNYEEVSRRPIGEIQASEVLFLNNYGLACLKAAKLCDDPALEELYVQSALEAFSLAVSVRERTVGLADIYTLRCITNKGIALERLGRLAESDACFALVDQRFRKAHYGKGQPGWLYNRYHQAIHLEIEAERAPLDGTPDGKLAKLKEAYAAHVDVLRDRERFNDGAQAIRKSKQHVLDCQRVIDELE